MTKDQNPVREAHSSSCTTKNIESPEDTFRLMIGAGFTSEQKLTLFRCKLVLHLLYTIYAREAEVLILLKRENRSWKNDL